MMVLYDKTGERCVLRWASLLLIFLTYRLLHFVAIELYNVYVEALSFQNAWTSPWSFARATRKYEIYNNTFITDGQPDPVWVINSPNGGE